MVFIENQGFLSLSRGGGKNSFNIIENGTRVKTTDRSATYDVFVRKPFFHYDPVRCGMPTLYGTVSERAAKTIQFNTLWQWKGYPVG